MQLLKMISKLSIHKSLPQFSKFWEPQLYTLCSVGEYGWLIKGKVMMEADSDTEVDINADTLPTHQLVLAKMITGLGLG